jgi:hypothetical protein
VAQARNVLCFLGRPAVQTGWSSHSLNGESWWADRDLNPEPIA